MNNITAHSWETDADLCSSCLFCKISSFLQALTTRCDEDDGKLCEIDSGHFIRYTLLALGWTCFAFRAALILITQQQQGAQTFLTDCGHATSSWHHHTSIHDLNLSFLWLWRLFGCRDQRHDQETGLRWCELWCVFLLEASTMANCSHKGTRSAPMLSWYWEVC